MKYLTLFTIGPVQSFIAKARKLQDLYAGSFLLSHLTKQTMLKAQKEGATILFPNPELESAPNRFLLTIDHESTDSLREFCETLDRFVREEWENLAKTVFAELKLNYSDAAKTQIESLLQVYYASEPYLSGEEYGDCYINVIKRLGIAKMLRDFVQLDEEPGRKCNVMHDYNALFSRKRQNFLVADSQIVTTDNIPSYKLDKYIESDETLSAPALVKRCLVYALPDKFNDSFPSVTQIFEMYGRKLGEDDDRQGYYAVLIFDGDDMGVWYSKPDLHDSKKAETEIFQAILSNKISEFAAEKSRKIVDWDQGQNGIVIYAGGEDFLGALNIASVFSTLKQLRETFGEINLTDYTDKTLKFSAGVIIAHVKTPLSEVLKMAHAAEHKAKSHPGKDAYCITIAKRSGETTEFVLPFTSSGSSTLDSFDRLAEIIDKEELSPKFIYQLGIELERIATTENEVLQKKVFLTEAKRLLNNSDMSDKEKKAKLVKESYEILEKLTDISNTQNILMYLQAVAFIARERGYAS